MKTIWKKRLSMLLAGLLCLAFPLSAQAGTSVPKEEVVYATLSNDGAVLDATVVNIFTVEAAEGADVIDYGAYTSVSNLSNTEPITHSAGQTRAHADKGRFYYQGLLDGAQLPWNISLIYSLDYVPVASDALAGRSGRLGVRLTTTKNAAVDAAFYDNYMLQISFTLDSAKCVNIDAPGATVANAGSSKQLTFTSLAGKDADCSFSADVVDFEMDGVSINAVPMSLSIDRPDTTSLTEDVTKLQDAITDLDAGVKDLRAGVRELAAGTVELTDGSHKFLDGLGALPAAGTQFGQASYQFNQTLKGLQTQAGSPLSSSGGTDGALAAREAATAAGTFGSLRAYLTDPAVAAAVANMNALLDNLTQRTRKYATICGTISGAVDGNGDLIHGLADNYDSYNRQLQAFLAGLDALDENYKKLDDGLKEVRDGLVALSGGMGELKDGTGELNDETADMDAMIDEKIDELMSDYDKADYVPKSFASEKNQNVTSVQFVIKTSGIEKAEETTPEEAPEEAPTFWERFLALFS